MQVYDFINIYWNFIIYLVWRPSGLVVW
jgi:hypothetical protein